MLGCSFDAASHSIHRGRPCGVIGHLEILDELNEELENDFCRSGA